MRELIAIDFNEAQKTPYNCGRIGEHNAQPMSVTPPEELDGADYYRVVFDDGMNPVYSAQLTAAPFAFTLVQDVTENSPVKMWVEGYRSDMSYIGKSKAATLVFSGPRESGAPDLQDTEPHGLLVELLAAKDDANEAAGYANDAGIEALSKASAAEDARIAANGAASSANSAASSANNAALSANAAAELANDKAGLADEKAILADTAAGNADQAVITLTGTVNSAVSQAQEDVAGALQTMEANLATFEDVTEAITDAETATAAAQAAVNGAATLLTDVTSLNLFDKESALAQANDYATGYYVKYNNPNGGTLVSSAVSSATGYLACVPGDVFRTNESSTRMMAFYNSSKVFVSGLNAGWTTATVPAGCAFARFSYLQTAIDSLMITCNGEIPSMYLAYGQYTLGNFLLNHSGSDYIALAAAGEDAAAAVVTANAASANAAVFLNDRSVLNIFDKESALAQANDYATGYYVKYNNPNGGTLVSSAIASVTGYLACVPGDVFRTNQVSKMTMAFYTAEEAYVSGLTAWTDCVAPSTAAFARFTYLTSDVDTLVITRNGEIPAVYMGYGKYNLNGLLLDRNSDDYASILNGAGTALTRFNGKYLLTIGDSMTQGRMANGSTASPRWCDIVAQNLGMTVINPSIVGATCRDNGGVNVWSTDWETILANYTIPQVDYISIYLGANDGELIGSQNIGTTASTDRVTFCGALKNLIQDLINEYPTAQIFCITPTHPIPLTIAAIKAVCDYMKVPYYDLHGKGGLNITYAGGNAGADIIESVNAYYNTWYDPGTGVTGHWTQAGHTRVGQMITSWMQGNLG